MDVARTAYVGLPFRVRRIVAPLVQRLPFSLRYGSTYVAWRRTIAAARADAAFGRELHERALRRTLRLAAEKSPYYRETLSPILGAVPAEGGPVPDALWRSIPLIDGKVVATERDRMCTRPAAELDRSSTGGSSGKPLSFYVDRNRSPTEYAFVMEAWATVGMEEDDWHAVFRGFEIPDPGSRPFEVESSLRELRISVLHMSDDLMPVYLDEIRRRNIRFLKGYPSAFGTLAAYMLRHGLSDGNIRGILLHSEPVHDLYRDRLKRVFPNAVVRGFYGLSEKCAFATECNVPGQYAFDPLYGYTELLDSDGHPVTRPGSRGQIVATGLLYNGMPFIRYNTQDEATLVALPGAANGYRLHLADIRPRSAAQMIVTRSRYLIESNALFMMNDELDGVAELQFEQSRPGIVEMRCVVREPDAEKGAAKFADMVAAKTNGEIEIKVELVDRIPGTVRGKRPLTIQKLDIGGYDQVP